MREGELGAQRGWENEWGWSDERVVGGGCGEGKRGGGGGRWGGGEGGAERRWSGT